MTVPAELRQLLDAELSLPSRVRYVGLLLGSLGMTAITGSLWLTEPRLPLRTRLAFAALTLIGVAWTAFAVWVLTHRRILLANHRIVAGWMAVTFSSLFVAGASAVGYSTGVPAAYAAAACGAVLLAAAIVLLVRAQQRQAGLQARRTTLERELQRSTR